MTVREERRAARIALEAQAEAAVGEAVKALAELRQIEPRHYREATRFTPRTVHRSRNDTADLARSLCYKLLEAAKAEDNYGCPLCGG